MNVLVTGAAGRIGSKTTQWLLDRGHTVRATDRRRGGSLPATVPLEYADLCDPLSCYRLVDGMDAVVHLGNHPHHIPGQGQRIFSENGTMTGNVFMAALELGVQRIIYASSIQAVMGCQSPSSGPAGEMPCLMPYLPLDSQMPANPTNEYGASKVAGEMLLQWCCQAKPITGIALRFPAVWSERMTLGQTPARTRNWGGKPEALSYLFVQDAAELIECAVRAPITGYHNYLPADYVNCYGLPPREAYETHLSNVPLRVPLEQLHTLTDCTVIQRELGWRQPGQPSLDETQPADGPPDGSSDAPAVLEAQR
jgi:nucleoside-diphosphate-sugar epimerase